MARPDARNNGGKVGGGLSTARQRHAAAKARLQKEARIAEAEANLERIQADQAHRVELARAATRGLRISPAVARRNARKGQGRPQSEPTPAPAVKALPLTPAQAMARVATASRSA